jgi:hypothetical protein
MIRMMACYLRRGLVSSCLLISQSSVEKMCVLCGSGHDIECFQLMDCCGC